MSAPFLAWIRTALAILAGSIAIDQLAPHIAPVPVRIVLCVVWRVSALSWSLRHTGGGLCRSRRCDTCASFRTPGSCWQ
ncbi:DUF202 domain-containing protein [Paenarthrobacter sp. PH39-S1]|uniref:DUF202 domain-containing protein n=1 Tax=Paenarthrobacter sp. PH39-S1 TaxID=3046204 RepID=UPI0024B8CC31|nr:DUF202 domain-containing protein [Paenarthrobacter sp. PH39-S1]MDJ0358192.1 DUF202 domain-containing protein [Paenarthrobacter sp. PH39-S1]